MLRTFQMTLVFFHVKSGLAQWTLDRIRMFNFFAI